MRVFGCQLNIAWEDPKANHARVLELLDAETLPPRSLVVLPEMFATGFSMDLARTCEPGPSVTDAFLARLARDRGVYVMGGVVRPAGGGKGGNESVLYSPEGGEVCRYRKMQPFSLGGEGECYEAGDEVVTCVIESISVAPLICYDLRFPELFRDGVRKGAQLFVVIANWPNARTEHWVTLLRARAIENMAYVVGVNRCGTDPKLTYDGRSLIVDPLGRVVADAGADETIFSAGLDLPGLLEWREAFPALRDMRR